MLKMSMPEKKVLSCSKEEKADSAIYSDTKVNNTIVSSCKTLDITKAVAANDFVDYDVVNDKIEKNQHSTYQKYNDTYSDAGNLDCRKKLISVSSEGKAESAINSDSKMNISTNKKKEKEMNDNLVMSLSWDFPARAKPSYEGSEPSQDGALH